MVWAFAKVNQSDEKLFTYLVTEVQHWVQDFNAQDVANTAWSFATAKGLDEKLFATLARTVEQWV